MQYLITLTLHCTNDVRYCTLCNNFRHYKGLGYRKISVNIFYIIFTNVFVKKLSGIFRCFIQNKNLSEI